MVKNIRDSVQLHALAPGLITRTLTKQVCTSSSSLIVPILDPELEYQVTDVQFPIVYANNSNSKPRKSKGGPITVYDISNRLTVK